MPQRYPRGDSRAWCTKCNAPTTIKYRDVVGFDTEWVLCEECKPRVDRIPRVTLWGAPEGQELARWSDDLRSTQVDTPGAGDANDVQVDIDALRGSDDVW